MTREKETTIYFADGNQADIYRYEPNYYAIQFSTGSIWYGSYLKILNIIKDYEAKLINVNEHDNEENHPMTSCGRYMNLWTTGGDYDVFILFHEAEDKSQIDKVVDKMKDICHSIMGFSHLTTNRKQELIKIYLDNYTEYGVQIFIHPIKKEDD